MAEPIKARDVVAGKVEWLWRERIPRGMITTVAGRPDQGKGLFAAHVAAEITRPRSRAEHTVSNARVLYSAAEDSHEVMTRPRLEAAGARLDSVLLWRFTLPGQMRELAQIVVKNRIDLIVMDPFAAHLGSGVSRHADNVRQVLQPLTELIERTGTAVLIIEHALKRVPKNGHPLNAIGGSGSGLPAASRMAYLLGQDPDDEDRRVLAPVKANVRQTPQALAFEVDVEVVPPAGEVASLIFDQELQAFDPMRLFAAPSEGRTGRPPDKRAAAAEWLTNYLAAAGRPVAAGRVMEEAKHYGMATKTLRRAAEDLGVVRTPPGGGRNCTWELPDELKKLVASAQTDAPDAWDQGLADLLGGEG